MAYTEQHTTSYGSRVGGSFKGIITGVILFCVGTGILWWNEGRTVRQGDVIAEAKVATIELQDTTKIDNSFDGKLVHTTGKAIAQSEVIDNDFATKQKAIAIERKVEYFQWVENSSSKSEKKLGGSVETTTTYTYEKKWVANPVNSSNFKEAGHNNTVRANIENKTNYAEKVGLGAYLLNESQIRSIRGETPLTLNLDKTQLDKIKNTFSKDNFDIVKVNGNEIYFGNALAKDAQIGDVRISFFYVPDDQEISIISQINGNSFQSWKASNDETFSMLKMGNVSLNDMIQSADDENNFFKWLLRAGGILVVIVGLKMIVAPLAVMADVIPALGSIVNMISSVIVYLIGIAWSLVVIAIAWIRFRPMLGISLLIIAGICVVATIFFKKKNAVNVAVESTAIQNT